MNTRPFEKLFVRRTPWLPAAGFLRSSSSAEFIISDSKILVSTLYSTEKKDLVELVVQHAGGEAAAHQGGAFILCQLDGVIPCDFKLLFRGGREDRGPPTARIPVLGGCKHPSLGPGPAREVGQLPPKLHRQ